MNSRKNIKRRLMFRIYAIWFFQRLFHPVTIEIIALTFLFVTLQYFVSLGNVLWNMQVATSPQAFFSFVGSALRNTEPAVLVAILAGMFTVALIVRDVRAVFFAYTGRVENNPKASSNWVLDFISRYPRTGK